MGRLNQIRCNLTAKFSYETLNKIRNGIFIIGTLSMLATGVHYLAKDRPELDRVMEIDSQLNSEVSYNDLVSDNIDSIINFSKEIQTERDSLMSTPSYNEQLESLQSGVYPHLPIFLEGLLSVGLIFLMHKPYAPPHN
jgi:hypothetical protein